MRAAVTALMALCTLACGGAAPHAPAAATSEDTAGDERAAPREPARPLDDEEAARAYAQGMQVHVRARELRALCDEGDADACREAAQLFGLAADTWRALVEGRPDDETAEWSFLLAQALFHSDRFDPSAEAADHYLTLGAPDWRMQAARLLVAARERSLEAASVRVRHEPPDAEGDPPSVRAVEIPAPVQRLVDARARLAEVVTEAGDQEREARAIALANALVLYRYGEWERAESALRPVFTDGCAGESAWEGAAIAWRALRDIAASLGRYDAVDALGQDIEGRGCDFGQAAASCGEGSEHPRCIARADRVAWRLRGGTRFLQRAQHARGAEQRELAVRAGEAFLAALEVEGELDARGRVTALVEAAGAFRVASAAERAAAIDERIVREVDPRALDEVDRPFAIASLASALSRQLEAALAASQHAQVVDLARRVLAPTFDLAELSVERERARAALPPALVALGRSAEASRAYAELAAATEDPSQRREAELRSALALVSGRSCGRASRPLRAFVSTHAGEEGAHDATVRALWQLAECQRRGTRQHFAALEEVVGASAGAGRGLGAESRDHVAEATFLLADRDFESATRVRLRVPAGENVEDMTENLRAELAAPTERVRELVQGYAGVERLGVGRWSVAARQRSGAALEVLDRAVLEASWELPLDLQRQRRTLSAAAFAQVQRIVELRAAQILRTQAAPIRCRAVAHYQRAIQVAGTANVESAEAQTARERLANLEIPERCPSAR